MRVDREPDGLHGADFQRRLVAAGLFGFQATEAVFGGDGAVVAGDDVVDDLRALLPAGEEGFQITAQRAQHVIVDVAVADVAEGADTGPGVEAFDGGGRLLEEVGDAGERDGDIVLPAPSLGPLGRRLFLAHLPEGGALGVILDDGGVVDQAGLEGVAQQPFHG